MARRPSYGDPDDGHTGWRPLDAAAGLFARLTDALNAVGTVWILAIMVLINADVVGRGLFGAPIAGVPELVELSIVGIVFLQLASTLRARRLARSDMVPTLLRRRARRLGLALEALFNVAGMVVVSAMFYAGLPLFVRAWERETFVGAIGHFTAPIWPINLIILIGCAALAVQFLFNALVCCAWLGRGAPVSIEAGGPPAPPGDRPAP